MKFAYDLVIACQVLHATSGMTNTDGEFSEAIEARWPACASRNETNRNFAVLGIVVGTFKGHWFGILMDVSMLLSRAWMPGMRF